MNFHSVLILKHFSEATFYFHFSPATYLCKNNKKHFKVRMFLKINLENRFCFKNTFLPFIFGKDFFLSTEQKRRNSCELNTCCSFLINVFLSYGKTLNDTKKWQIYRTPNQFICMISITFSYSKYLSPSNIPVLHNSQIINDPMYS